MIWCCLLHRTRAILKVLFSLQNKYISEVLNPHEAQKETLERLKSGAYFLPDPTAADEIFKKFEDLSSEIERYFLAICNTLYTISKDSYQVIYYDM